ncbi:MAG: LAGLIDADG family homing endonuclease [Candidatus Aenigmatarchaeota archaeon]
MEREELVEKFSEFLNERCMGDLVTALTENRKSISVDFSLLDKFDVELADYLIEQPEDALSAAEEAIKSIDTGMVESKLRVRFYNLPASKNIRIRSIRAEHLGKMLVVDGVVKSASEVRPEISEAVFACPECGMRMSVMQAERNIKAPDRCECGCKRGFSLVDQKMFDVRWVTVEEPFEITSGEQPSELTILMKEDLTTPLMQNRTEPGNRILITGVLKHVPRVSRDASSRMMDIYLDANHVDSIEVGWEELNISPDDEQKIIELSKDPLLYDKLVASLAPTIYGLNDIKESIILQMFAGEQHVLRDKTRIRGNLHLLLVGDPACLVADERIVLADGTIMKMAEAGTRHLQKIDLHVHTGSGRNYGRADRFHVYRKQPVMEIVTETGKSIKGSYNQPVLVLDNTSNVWKRLDEIRIGDRVRTLSKIECKIKSPVETGWSDKDYYHKKPEWKIKVPAHVDEKLAAIFGYVVADGWVQKNRVGFVISKDESDILPELECAFADCFGAPVSTYVHRRASRRIAYYQVNRTHAAELLQFLKEKRVPGLIFKSGNRVVASFLRWLYEGDGTAFANGRGRTSVSLRSASIELLRDVQMLLLRFGIHSRILWDGRGSASKIDGRVIKGYPSGTLMIRRSGDILRFFKNVGFASAKKKDRLAKVVEYAKAHVRRVHKERAEKIVRISRHPAEDVFDIEVPVHHRFVANGIVVHNTAKSQIMKLASTMIPRGKYASGTAVSGAGLTATVVREEKFVGGWVLEAGALVLANRSICAIDEFSHVAPHDMIKLQEAMSLETISIAKASIVATLPAQTAILAGANPKFGRFDPYIPIKEQLDINEVMLSRFDLRFALKDVPNPETDKKIADHVLKMRHFEEDAALPAIDPAFLRKYIAYARANVHPKLTVEAGEKLKEFYLEMRAMSGEDSAVSITVRQYDSLIRMSEASAKVRLSETVDIEDAQRAINLMSLSLRQFGFEPSTGKIDIDRVEGQRMTSAQRGKTKIMMDVIAALEAELGKEMPRDELVRRAAAEGIDDAEDILRKLLQIGDLYEPRQNVISRVHG